ncbi:hypothetical protein KPH14_004701 [Odynerus spinipes]|uniref:Uncharacterized protein n=1 Tax=Odynerus spinipes TaxID=1348599 RepID=A0AAD9RMS8_9HYME|nr:hypothetical protein KPH14_004701 [Odynerus spinipes]
MNTPVLTKKQQKQSLSAKKGPIKGLRNVLAKPQDTYWPVISQMDGVKLNDALQQSLPALRRPQKEKKKKKKLEECTNLKEESIRIEEPLPNKDLLNSVVMGINTVTRSLEKNENKKKPVLLLQSLRNLTLENIGFPCSALALKNKASSLDHHFYTLYKSISSISQNYPPRQSLQLFTSDEVSSPTMFEDNKVDDNVCKENTLNVNKESISLTDVYKFRTSCKERTFVPPNAAQNLDDVQKEADFISLDSDFISLGNDMDVSDNEDVQHTRKTRYFKPCLKKDNKFQNLNNRYNYTNNNSTSRGISGNLKMGKKQKKNFQGNAVEYLPLKIKRLKGNSNRLKATKVSKKKKKNQHK